MFYCFSYYMRSFRVSTVAVRPVCNTLHTWCGNIADWYALVFCLACISISTVTETCHITCNLPIQTQSKWNHRYTCRCHRFHSHWNDHSPKIGLVQLDAHKSFLNIEKKVNDRIMAVSQFKNDLCTDLNDSSNSFITDFIQRFWIYTFYQIKNVLLINAIHTN